MTEPCGPVTETDGTSRDFIRKYIITTFCRFWPGALTHAYRHQEYPSPLNGSGDLEAVMSVALDFARRFDAHLSAVVVGSDPSEVATLAGEGISAGMVNEMIDTATTEAQRRAIAIRKAFDAFIHEHGIRRVEPSKIGSSAGDGVSASLDVLNGTEHDS